MNKLIIVGNLTRDPELRTTQNGKNVCTFTVAVNRRKGDEADFFRVSAWDQLGDNCQRYLAKGRKVAVIGSVSVNSYTTQNGEHRASLEVSASEVEFLSSKNEGQQNGENAPQTVHKAAPANVPVGYEEVTDDDFPF